MQITAKNQSKWSTFWWFSRVVNKILVQNCMDIIKEPTVEIIHANYSQKSINMINMLVIQQGSE